MIRQGKVALHGVHHDIDDAAPCLEWIHCIGKLGIENGKEGAVIGGIKASLEAPLLVGDDAGRAHLTSGGGQGQNGAHRERTLGLLLFFKEFPRLHPRIGNAVRDTFCGV